LRRLRGRSGCSTSPSVRSDPVSPVCICICSDSCGDAPAASLSLSASSPESVMGSGAVFLARAAYKGSAWSTLASLRESRCCSPNWLQEMQP
jgi:hypothetical protein